MLLERFVEFVAVLFGALFGCELVVGGVRGCLFWRLAGFRLWLRGLWFARLVCLLWVAVESGWFVAICCGAFRGFVGLVTVVWLAVGWSVGLVNSAGLLS